MFLLIASGGVLVKRSQTLLVEHFSRDETQCALNYLDVKKQLWFGLNMISFHFKWLSQAYQRVIAFQAGRLLRQENMGVMREFNLWPLSYSLVCLTPCHPSERQKHVGNCFNIVWAGHENVVLKMEFEFMMLKLCFWPDACPGNRHVTGCKLEQHYH